VKSLEHILSQFEPVLLGDELRGELLGGEEGDLEVWMEGKQVESESEEWSSVSDRWERRIRKQVSSELVPSFDRRRLTHRRETRRASG